MIGCKIFYTNNILKLISYLNIIYLLFKLGLIFWKSLFNYVDWGFRYFGLLVCSHFVVLIIANTSYSVKRLHLSQNFLVISMVDKMGFFVFISPTFCGGAGELISLYLWSSNHYLLCWYQPWCGLFW